MKRNLFYLLPLLLILGEACTPKSDNTPIPVPSGTFKGKFRLVTRKATGGADTLKDTALVIKLTSPYHFAITGDTIKVHAGSKGNFGYDGYNMSFLDSTYKAGPQVKYHLVGIYQYFYNGTLLQLQRTNATGDTVLRYDFNKTSN
ncbi:hypothetical protein [Mucilaginibacter sp. SP1R1]|uniref:hypothetical protein n=1 Tax=Mucilaginibacter sp. SP1R1 TaxID=2723091 RepID=UPI001614C799|nr:hypothetical protein [Mucilaginibacter sp. SP1R1]MBB6152039.1 hypothetical protein [Mucilaginibacter sp. SP1R1]